jgi:hypothetical protein
LALNSKAKFVRNKKFREKVSSHSSRQASVSGHRLRSELARKEDTSPFLSDPERAFGSAKVAPTFEHGEEWASSFSSEDDTKKGKEKLGDD